MKILQAFTLPGRRAVPPSQQNLGIYGAERSTTLLCRGLQERGHEVTLVCRPGVPLIDHARAMGVRVAPMVTRNPRTLPLVWQLVRLAKAQGAEILVGHNGRSCRLINITARVLGVPSVATMRVLYSAKNFRTATRIIAVSEGVRQHILAQGVAPQQVVTVHNGADLARFAPPDDLAACKRAAGFAADETVVGVIARLSVEKGHDWFLSAVAPLAREFPQARFLIVGEGVLREELQQRAATLGLAERARFVGYQPEVVPWLAAMDMLVLPSTGMEGFSRTLIEAGAMAKACIASPVGGNAEAIIDGETGLIVPTSDTGALTGAVHQLLSDSATRHAMGRAACARVQAHFSVESMVAKTEAVYRELLEKRR